MRYEFLLYYKCHKVNSKSYMDTPHWIKSKRETINSINKNDNKYFQYPVTVSSNHRKISKHPERISQIMPFADKCNWKGINYPPGKDN